MEHYLSTAFAKHLLNKNIIKEEMFEVYVYGAELFLSSVFTDVIIIIIGVIIRRLIATFFYLLVFILLRRFTGGYHATTYLKCKMTMIAMYAFTIASAIYVEISIYWYVLLMVAGNVTIFFSAPIENPNKRLDESQKKKCKILSSNFSYIPKMTQNTPLLIPGKIAPLPIAIPIIKFCKKYI